MAIISVQIPPKAALSPQDQARCVDFGTKLQQAMTIAAHENATRLSSVPVQHVGVTAAPKKSFVVSPTLQRLKAPGNQKWAVHQGADFLSSNSTASFSRAHYGYSMEVETQAVFEREFGKFYGKGVDYLYNDPNQALPSFPVNYNSAIKSARPDWRLKLLSSPGEAIFDATSEKQKGHLLLKKVGSSTLDKIPKILYGAEIIYETKDAYFNTSSASYQARFFMLCVLIFGTAGALLYYLGLFGGSPEL